VEREKMTEAAIVVWAHTPFDRPPAGRAGDAGVVANPVSILEPVRG
jgi:hypothetical protein